MIRNPGGWNNGVRIDGVSVRCGLRVKKRKRSEHQQACPECLAIKAVNIKKRMERHNRSDEQRKRASETAKRTSARPEIQAARAALLRKWREENPEAFSKCTAAAQASPKRSKPEAWLRENLLLGWPQGQIRCGEERKQVDFISESVWVEVDGFFHFFEVKRIRDTRPSRLKRTLAVVQGRDAMLNQEARSRGICLIRVGVDCFARDGALRDEWKRTFTAMLHSMPPGVWCLGRLYEPVLWAQDGCTILKFPTLNTTTFSPTE